MSAFLYPSLEPLRPVEGDGDLIRDAIIVELVRTVQSTWTEAASLDERTLNDNAVRLDRAADLMLKRIMLGGRILALGNGGSACDADRLVRMLAGIAPARSLLDPAVVSALANDIGSARMFARQVETFATASDVVVAFSTSGTSPNIIEALAAARRVGAGTIALAGYGGAALATSADVDVCLHVGSESVHRIQEAQGALTSALVARLEKALS